MKRAAWIPAFVGMTLAATPVFGAAQGLRLEISPRMQKSLGIKTVPARRGIWRGVLRLPGAVLPLPQNAREIHSPVTGQVLPGAPPAVGERAPKGRVLAVIRQTLTAAEAAQLESGKIKAQASLAESRNNLRFKEKAFARAKRLYAAGVAALQDLQSAQTDAENAFQQFEAAKRLAAFYAKKRSYQDFPLISPISGIITALDIAPGETVNPQKALFKVEDLSKVWVETRVYENEISGVFPGQTAEIAVRAVPGKLFFGKVRTVGLVMDPQSRTLPAVIELSNPRLLLKEGMLAQARLAGRGENALTVPVSGVVEENGARFVFEKVGSAVFLRRGVEIQKIRGDTAFILKGIHPGARVVSRGAYLLNQEWHNQSGGSRD